MTADMNCNTGSTPPNALPGAAQAAIPRPSYRGPWMAIIALTATIVGAAGGLLAWAGGANPPNAVLVAGAALGGTAALIFAAFNFHDGPGR
ncbi:hypothetical protein AB0B62_01410 [Micromonospora chalcea]|uniref:hypothetical protein n=1 Tax=Micromonospora TaxID=1873 RepID=UPI001AE250B7|nr:MULTISPECIES: hypothetical protein [unclassified Micromonospora]MBP1781808.1 hypothetical protein [Micromonospora sp. HB375]MDH6466518.1 hypothetical protein [Micromonospora sp. H404/HB375]